MAEMIPLRYDFCCLFVCFCLFFCEDLAFRKQLFISLLPGYFTLLSVSREMCELDKKIQIKIYRQFTFFEMSFRVRLTNKQSNYKSALRTDRQALR